MPKKYPGIRRFHLPPNEDGERTYCKQSNIRTGIANIALTTPYEEFIALSEYNRCKKCLNKFNNNNNVR